MGSRRINTFAFSSVVALVGLGVAASWPVAADPVEDFYKGKQIRLVIGYSAGGSYDVYGRAFARHFERHIPGKPTVVPQNMDGAGSRVAANWLYNVAPKDGTVIGTIGQNTPLDQTLKAQGVQFDARQFQWIGNINSENNLTFTWNASGLRTLDDVKSKGGLICGGTGATTPGIIFPTILKNMFGYDMRIIAGYPGANEIDLAIERGELNCRATGTFSTMTSTLPSWMEGHKISFLIQWGLKKNPEVSKWQGRDVPLIGELAPSDDDRRALALILSAVGMGRPFAVPPGVPEERVRALRTAFDATMADPQFLADMARQKLDVAPAPGREIQRLAIDTVEAPESAVERSIAITKPQNVEQTK